MNGSTVRSGGWRRTSVAMWLLAFAGTSSAMPAVALDTRCVEVQDRVRVSERLVRKAEVLADKGTTWELAGELMVQAAALRSECAIERMNSLRTAALYFGYAGEYDRASDASFQAGEHCVWNGHVSAGADAFINAATYALEAGDEARARTAASHASRLADSPHLTHLQRIAIQGRTDRLLEGGDPPAQTEG